MKKTIICASVCALFNTAYALPTSVEFKQGAGRLDQNSIVVERFNAKNNAFAIADNLSILEGETLNIYKEVATDGRLLLLDNSGQSAMIAGTINNDEVKTFLIFPKGVEIKSSAIVNDNAGLMFIPGNATAASEDDDVVITFNDASTSNSITSEQFTVNLQSQKNHIGFGDRGVYTCGETQYSYFFDSPDWGTQEGIRYHTGTADMAVHGGLMTTGVMDYGNVVFENIDFPIVNDNTEKQSVWISVDKNGNPFADSTEYFNERNSLSEIEANALKPINDFYDAKVNELFLLENSMTSEEFKNALASLVSEKDAKITEVMATLPKMNYRNFESTSNVKNKITVANYATFRNSHVPNIEVGGNAVIDNSIGEFNVSNDAVVHGDILNSKITAERMLFSNTNVNQSELDTKNYGGVSYEYNYAPIVTTGKGSATFDGVYNQNALTIKDVTLDIKDWQTLLLDNIDNSNIKMMGDLQLNDGASLKYSTISGEGYLAGENATFDNSVIDNFQNITLDKLSMKNSTINGSNPLFSMSVNSIDMKSSTIMAYGDYSDVNIGQIDGNKAATSDDVGVTARYVYVEQKDASKGRYGANTLIESPSDNAFLTVGNLSIDGGSKVCWNACRVQEYIGADPIPTPSNPVPPLRFDKESHAVMRVLPSEKVTETELEQSTLYVPKSTSDDDIEIVYE